MLLFMLMHFLMLRSITGVHAQELVFKRALQSLEEKLLAYTIDDALI